MTFFPLKKSFVCKFPTICASNVFKMCFKYAYFYSVFLCGDKLLTLNIP